MLDLSIPVLDTQSTAWDDRRMFALDCRCDGLLARLCGLVGKRPTMPDQLANEDA